MKTSVASDKHKSATFTIEPLSPGYGVTLGNSLRRVMLSSLEGSAVSSVKIDGVSHEFSSLENMREDIVNFVLNLKGLPVRLHGDEAATITIDVKGPKKVTASDIKPSSQVEIIDSTYELANLEKSGKLKAEITIEKGRGFVPTEKRIDEKMSLGTILVDSVFTPIKKIHYSVVNTRVGSVTNFDKLTIDVSTNGSITPEEAMKRACQILNDHFTLVNEAIIVKEPKAVVAKKTKVTTKIKTTPKETKTQKTVSKAKK
jgi:DNA-directed RNA polymerase subunit alpha